MSARADEQVKKPEHHNRPVAKSRTKPWKPMSGLKHEERHTKHLAALVLEVLAGLRTPTEAAESLGVSVARYYALEMRALEGLLSGCRRRPQGPRRSAEQEIAKLRKEVERLEGECARTRGLLRAAERALGLKRVPERPAVKGAGKGKRKGKRRRRPTVRALKAVKVLRSPSESDVKAGGEEKGARAAAEKASG